MLQFIRPPAYKTMNTTQTIIQNNDDKWKYFISMQTQANKITHVNDKLRNKLKGRIIAWKGLSPVYRQGDDAAVSTYPDL